MSATQKLRELLEDTRYGLADATMLHNALLELEIELGLPVSRASDERVA